jgi:hypothetical protein
MKILILLILTSCSSLHYKVIDKKIGKDVLSIIEEFKRDHLKYLHSEMEDTIEFRFVDSHMVNRRMIAGECTIGLDTAIISLDYTNWMGLDYKASKNLIYHELGHCVLGKKHNDLTDGDYALDIMHSSLNVKEMGENEIQELFR